jgi:hypothetical protein
MHRRLFLIGSAAALGACTTNDRPDEPGDACAMFENQSGWWRAVRRAENNWGAPPALQLAIIRQESGFRYNARPPRGRFLFIFPGARASSARGYAQALNATWDEYERARGDDGADRTEFSDAADFVAWYARRSRDQLGLDWNDARSHYLAYHEGQGGYRNGAWRSNDRLQASADRVQGYHDAYAGQLSRCERDLNSWWPF